MHIKIWIMSFIFFTTISISSYETPCTLQNLGGNFPENVCLLKFFFEQLKQNTPGIFPIAYLFYGEHGTGKTTAALEVGKEEGINVEHFNTNDYIKNFDHRTPLTDEQSGYLSKILFTFYERIRERTASTKKPVAVLVDDVDLLGPYVFGSIRAQIDKSKETKQVVILLTAHKLSDVELGARQRCMCIELKKPDVTERRAILTHLNDKAEEKNKLTEKQVILLSLFTPGFVGKDLSSLIKYTKNNTIWNAYWQTLHENQQLSRHYIKNTLLCLGIIIIPFLVYKYKTLQNNKH